MESSRTWALHGAVGMAEDWTPWADEGVVGVDLWQVLADGGDSLEKAAELVAERAQDGDFLVGYSMGGRIALQALELRDWGGVSVISAHPGLETEEEKQARLAHDGRWAKKAERGDWGDFLRDWNAQAVLDPVEGWGDRALLEERRELVARSFRCWSLGRQKRTFLPDRQGGIWEKVRWFVGERDEKFCRLAPCWAKKVPRAGHRVPWEVARGEVGW